MSFISTTLSASKTEIDKNRSIQGVAYAGGLLDHEGETIAIDLASLALDDKQVPLLLNHNIADVVGYGWLSVEDNRLIIKGNMLSTAAAQDIIKAADEGLQWQMSVFVQSHDLRNMRAGDLVNGKEIDKDVILLTKSVIREVSFTPVGVDGNTSALIFSLSLNTGKPKNPPSNPKDIPMNYQAELAMRDARIASLEQRLADEEKRRAAEEAKRKTAILTALGVKEERAIKLSTADDEVFNEVVAELQLARKQQNLTAARYENGTENKRENPMLKGLDHANH